MFRLVSVRKIFVRPASTREVPCAELLPSEATAPTAFPSNRGLSLVEVILAMTILSIGLLALGGIAAVTNRSADYDAGRSFMINQAQILLEEIHGTSPGIIIAAYDGFVRTVTIDPSAGDELVLSAATLSVTVTEPQPDLLEITLIASWTVAGLDDQFTIRTGAVIE
jgi:prepilin-type N-terminal cleavage/methylation domain-containing protein